MSDKITSQTLAFAGICQAAALVQQLARQGNCDDQEFYQTLHSIIETDPQNPLAVFGSHQHLRLGYQTIINQLSAEASDRNGEITRYIVGLIALESKIGKRRDLMNMLGERVSQVKRQLTHFDLTSESVLANLASIYSDIISPNGPKIQVAGTPLYLQQPVYQHKIRALLLAGIRACVLWRQVGGRRHHIIFSRKKLTQQAQKMITQF
ncbi:high frequency lysogenization protein HflD [Dongshaea marina]|uniref:high frequency lysogenization protein HflD n=1 Tax=Dongshaea marina TaxID=2047966 RepID=UPI000D3E0E62|nr:high frequency lysogenization protein HflD [Dongshaea marina]